MAYKLTTGARPAPVVSLSLCIVLQVLCCVLTGDEAEGDGMTE